MDREKENISLVAARAGGDCMSGSNVVGAGYDRLHRLARTRLPN